MLTGISQLLSKLLDHPRAGNLLAFAALVSVIVTAALGAAIAAGVLAGLLFVLFLIFMYGVSVRDRFGGPYEISKMVNELDIQSIDGSLAVHRKQLSLEFLHNQVVAIWEGAYGDGEQFADFKCTPTSLRAVDEFVEGGRRHKVISLRRLYNRGDKIDVTFERTIKNALLDPEREAFLVDVTRRTQTLIIRIIFHKEHKCTEATLYRRHGKKSSKEPLTQSFSYNEEGRQVIEWKKSRPKLGDTYTFEWTW